jgi:serine/threonine-protein kinase PRP4
MHKEGFVHADIKPDNILVKNNTVLKLCDFGTCFSANDEAPRTQYLVSRFYRAPEIILGSPADSKVDIWSAAVTLFELYTSKLLFNGRNNQELLRQIVQLRGRPNSKQIKKSELGEQYFNAQNPNEMYILEMNVLTAQTRKIAI